MRRLGRAIRYSTLIVTGTLAIVAFAASTLVAPGPPDEFIEPQTRMVLVAVRPGTFQMGSRSGEAHRGADEVEHTVVLTKPFFIGRFEVTQTEWAVVMRDNPSRFAGCGRCPVENVDFFQVDAFIANLNAQSTSMRYRLPTEAEWEYACRAGHTTAFAFGPRLLRAQANFDARFPYDGGSPEEPYDKTLTVGSFAPNAWGVYDMHGNVWEWTNDWYGPYDARETVDPRGAAVGTRRVVRGGSWGFDANSARCAFRYTQAPQNTGASIGFRVVAEPILRHPGDREVYRNR